MRQVAAERGRCRGAVVSDVDALPARYGNPLWRKDISSACVKHASLGPASLVLYDLSTLYLETDQGDGFREPGYSKERRLKQITIGLSSSAESPAVTSRRSGWPTRRTQSRSSRADGTVCASPPQRCGYPTEEARTGRRGQRPSSPMSSIRPRPIPPVDNEANTPHITRRRCRASHAYPAVLIRRRQNPERHGRRITGRRALIWDTRHSWPAAPRSIIMHYCERVVAEHSSNKALIWLDPTRVSAFGEQREVAARDDVGPTRGILARINAVGDASVLRKHRRHDVAHVTGLRQAGLR